MIFNFIVNKLMDNIDGRGGGIKSCLLFKLKWIFCKVILNIGMF